MKLLTDYLRDLGSSFVSGWNRFWFTPNDPATLGLIRILTGAMLLYTHLIWGRDLAAFYGQNAWVSGGAGQLIRDSPFAWSYFGLLKTPAQLWTAHYLALAVFALLTVGLWSRVTSILALLIAVSYANGAQAAMFGLDQINVLLVMYLAVGPSGNAYSIDRLLLRRRTRISTPAAPRSSVTIAIRLIQVHMAIIYLFAGLGKLQGSTWHDGTAMWYSFANYEYQSMDMTWIAAPSGWLPANIMTHITVVWELTYCVLVWPRLTRPIVIALAVPLHLGIAFCMGMMTFGLVMLIGNVAFISPWLVRRLLDRRAAPIESQPVKPTVAPRRRTA